MMSRRRFLGAMGGSVAWAAAGAPGLGQDRPRRPLNILFFTADDLHCQSLGCYGGEIADLTPNLDRFATEGKRFYRGHVNNAICMPSRIVFGTGLYGHNSGARGFRHAKEDAPSVIPIFQQAGYLTGVIGKPGHSTPRRSDQWDYRIRRAEVGNGRDPELYYQRTVDFFGMCRDQDKPFYLMVNSHDPHRPFHVAGDPIRDAKEPSRTYAKDEAAVPGFLPDLDGVRAEVAQYQNSVRRLDDTFGRVMTALEESGQTDNTLVMFISDNGVSFPFAKCNCYLASTLTPWIVRWPGVVEPGSVDREHFISGVDYLPTILEATGIDAPERGDGRSFLPLLHGEPQRGRESVFTQIDSRVGHIAYPMRCVQNANFGYIFNAWHDGEYRYSSNNEGLTMRAMEEAREERPDVAERIDLYRYRVLEELYDLENDPDCLKNLVDDPQYAETADRMRADLRDYMVRSTDPVLKAFDVRHDEAARFAALQEAYGTDMRKAPRYVGDRSIGDPRKGESAGN